MSDDRIDSVRAEFMRECTVNGWKAFTYLDTNELLTEIATLRAKLEVCTAYAQVFAEASYSVKTSHEFWTRFRAAKDAFLAACGVAITPDDIPEDG